MLKRHSLVTIPFDDAHRLYDTEVDEALFYDDEGDAADNDGAHSSSVDRSNDDGGGPNGVGRIDSIQDGDTSSTSVIWTSSHFSLHAMN